MKKSKVLISSLLALSMMLTYGSFVLADETAVVSSADEAADDYTEATNDELAEQYILQELSVSDDDCYAAYNYTLALDQSETLAYSYIRSQVAQIAAGELTSTTITLPDSISFTFTASQLGLSDVNANTQATKDRVREKMATKMSKVREAVFSACPYELYWLGRDSSIYYNYYVLFSGQSVTVYGINYKIPVSAEYRLNGVQYTVDPAYGQAAKKAAANVKTIIDANASLSDYDKLLAYNNKICELVDYNYDVYESKDHSNGNPWQIVWVFDGDASTKVVCEGYAKAFQFLCDNSKFNDSSIYAISALGDISYANGDGGAHMWSIVHIGNGNYLVDVTRNDTSKQNKCFLVGAVGSVSSGYALYDGSFYTYDSTFKSAFLTSALTLTNSNYDPSSSSANNSSVAVATDVLLTGGVAHVQDIGNVIVDGDPTSGVLTIGTTGMGKRLEEITIYFENDSPYAGTLQYRVHVQDIGWMDWVNAGQKAGTEGLAKRIEAIELRLTGELADYYSVEYCVHIQDYGDMQGWVKDGALAGTTGESKRIEEIKIRIVPKGTGTMSVKYRVHVQDYGWEKSYASNGAMSGTSGESKRLEGIELFLSGTQYNGGIKYKTHVQDYGWQGWCCDGEMSGTQGEAKRLEGICIELYGEIADYYDIYYRVHAQDIGWMGWAKNGECAGTAGRSARLEGIQIVLVPKGSPAPDATYMGITAVDPRAFVEGF